MQKDDRITSDGAADDSEQKDQDMSVSQHSSKPHVVCSAFSGSVVSEVYLMDCVDLMKHYPDKYFDLAVVDPPYGIGADKKNAHSSIRDNDLYKDVDWDIKPHYEYFIELFRVSQNQIIWGGNYFLDFLPSTQCFLIWNKPERNFSLADAELAWTSFNKSARCFS